MFALPDRQRLLSLELPSGTTLRKAVLDSGMERYFPGLELAEAPLGVYGKQVLQPDEHVLQGGERIEIYRTLIADPKEVRKQRAAATRLAKAHRET
ncbi:hypothetical protein FHR87_002490 [Azomonas macrocytogenes]|uniref:UPF0125 protein FHR87_002490 n=1 Tax=Azomonas macrocytogenes TaxID=69962 RepID=A0A839T4S0_AZOMA|nr:hypothetical protein [Azomonas macrocytogenes]